MTQCVEEVLLELRCVHTMCVNCLKFHTQSFYYLQGIMGWPTSYSVNGDSHKLASPRAKSNQTALEGVIEEGLKMDVLQWDVCNLPLKTATVDVIVTDMVGLI